MGFYRRGQHPNSRANLRLGRPFPPGFSGNPGGKKSLWKELWVEIRKVDAANRRIAELRRLTGLDRRDWPEPPA